MQKLIHRVFNCDLPPQALIGKNTRLGHFGIGVVINPQAVIGDDCVIAQNVTIAGKDGGAPKIGNNVYVGANSVVMGDITIGDNCFIGALSLVNKSFPANCIIAGIPAKIIRYRTEEEMVAYERWHHKN